MLDNTRTKPLGGMVAWFAAAVALAIVVTCMLLPQARGFAAESGVVTSEQGTATLSVIAKDGEDAGAKPVAGMEFAAYEVARIGENGGYQVLAPFASVDAEYDREMTTAEMKELAGRLTEIAAKLDPSAKVTTNSEGIADLGRLENGVFLVVQTSAKGDAAGYTTSDPYLVNVPQFNADGTIAYDVKAYPKFKKLPSTSTTEGEKSSSKQTAPQDETEAKSVSKPTTTETKTTTATQSPSPSTGDHSSLTVVVGLALAGLAMVLVAAKKRQSAQS